MTSVNIQLIRADSVSILEAICEAAFVEQMLHAHQAAKGAIEQAGQRQKELCGRRKVNVTIREGDWALLSSDHCRYQGRTDKLTNKFLGPYKVLT